MDIGYLCNYARQNDNIWFWNHKYNRFLSLDILTGEIRQWTEKIEGAYGRNYAKGYADDKVIIIPIGSEGNILIYNKVSKEKKIIELESEENGYCFYSMLTTSDSVKFFPMGNKQNSVVTISLEDFSVSYEKPFSTYDDICFNNVGCIEKKSNGVYMLPLCNSSSIATYDPVTDQYGVLLSLNDSEAKFSAIQYCKDKVYLLAWNLAELFVCESENFSIISRIKLIDSDYHVPYFGMHCFKNYIFVIPRNSNCVCRVNTDTQEVSYYEIPNKKSDILHVECVSERYLILFSEMLLRYYVFDMEELLFTEKFVLKMPILEEALFKENKEFSVDDFCKALDSGTFLELQSGGI